MPTPLTTKYCKKKVKEALKDFGTYEFGDKGASEVMDVDEIEAGLRALSVDNAAALLKELSKGTQYDNILAGELLGCVQDWDELHAHPDVQEIDW